MRQVMFQGLHDDRPVHNIVREQTKPPGATAHRETRIVHVAEREVRPGTERIAGVDVTHPDRVIERVSGATRADLIRYYIRVIE